MGQREILSLGPLYLTFGTFSPVEIPAAPPQSARKMSARPLCHSAFTRSDAMSRSSETIYSQKHLHVHYASPHRCARFPVWYVMNRRRN